MEEKTVKGGDEGWEPFTKETKNSREKFFGRCCGCREKGGREE
jgi:hypothetical protein